MNGVYSANKCILPLCGSLLAWVDGNALGLVTAYFLARFSDILTPSSDFNIGFHFSCVL